MSEATTEEFLRKFTRELPVDLTDAELQSYGRMLADKVNEEQHAEAAKKEEMARRNAALKVITQEIARLADARAKCKELRGVMCGERIKGNVIEIVRLDSRIVVDTRPASLQDLQTTMPLDAMAPDVDEGRDNLIPFTPSLVPPDESAPPDDGGALVEQTNGDTVYVGAPDDRDAATEAEYGAQEPKTEFFVNPDAKPYPDEETPLTTWEDDIPEDQELESKEATIVGAVEADEDETDRKLRERDEWKADDEKAKTSAKKAEPAKTGAPKVTRERSKKANEAKPKNATSTKTTRKK